MNHNIYIQSPDRNATATRRGRIGPARALGGALALVGGALLAGCGSNSPNTATAATVSPSAEAGASSTAGAPPTSERPVPTVAGKKLQVAWQTVGNCSLAVEIRREGERFEGDPGASGTDDPKYWSKAAAIGVPEKETARESVLEVATVPDNSCDVRYAVVPKTDLAQVPLVDQDGGTVSTRALRVRVGPDGGTVGFVSGDIDGTPLNQSPSWAAESTLSGDMNTRVGADEYASIPLV